ncbi:MAG: hypothetical protein CEN90_656 [Parcubacteria group bacterium Licking1014_17]|nr:MAG: hypothetical protein CEN90_656 [Parcubacteria group bacterium Licking1014_17]
MSEENIEAKVGELKARIIAAAKRPELELGEKYGQELADSMEKILNLLDERGRKEPTVDWLLGEFRKEEITGLWHVSNMTLYMKAFKPLIIGQILEWLEEIKEEERKKK